MHMAWQGVVTEGDLQGRPAITWIYGWARCCRGWVPAGQARHRASASQQEKNIESGRCRVLSTGANCQHNCPQQHFTSTNCGSKEHETSKRLVRPPITEILRANHGSSISGLTTGSVHHGAECTMLQSSPCLHETRELLRLQATASQPVSNTAAQQE
eukprot:703361-Pelagomonas_calceolata.AAC.1